MVELKDFADFAYTLTEMEEVKESNFPIPKQMEFSIPEENHVRLQKQIFAEKNMNLQEFEPTDVFDVVFYGVIFRFTIQN